MEIELLWLALASFLGALAAALLGWAESSDPFDGRKFLASAVRGLIAAAAFAAGFSLAGRVTWFHYLGAFLGGAGMDVLGKRGAAAVNSVMSRGRGRA